KQHIKSLMFGLGAGLVVLFLLMFTFFNERYIIPFVKPNQISASTPIITVPGAAVSSDPKVIIPKLNVEAPVVYNVPFIETGETEADFESRVQKALENGVVYYPTSQKPGETGKGFNSNVAIVGHSSNNLFSSGKYKFAFMQIGQLEPGDTFMLNYNSKQYVYKVYEKKVVKPTDVTVLGPASRPNSATLITCDPPGFNINRMVIIGEQISPSPKKNTLTNKQTETPENLIVPSNPKTMWERFWGWVSGD
ncbi:sortase, partial [Candidatus Saccharibacteria bacterium]|nr:sortase [Candidatus Saccharibacteria bacterium]